MEVWTKNMSALSTNRSIATYARRCVETNCRILVVARHYLSDDRMITNFYELASQDSNTYQQLIIKLLRSIYYGTYFMGIDQND